LTEFFELRQSKLFWFFAALAVIGTISGTVAFNSVQNVYDTDPAQLQADFDNYIFEHAKDYNNLKQAMQTIDEDHHDIFDEISANFTAVTKAHRNLMAMVITEETTDEPAPSVNHFNLQTDPEWKRGELITITGTLPQSASSLEASVTQITSPDCSTPNNTLDRYCRTFNVAVFDDKTFTMPFALATNDPLGQYTVTFKSLGKFDSISFKAIE